MVSSIIGFCVDVATSTVEALLPTSMALQGFAGDANSNGFCVVIDRIMPPSIVEGFADVDVLLHLFSALVLFSSVGNAICAEEYVFSFALPFNMSSSSLARNAICFR